MAQFRPEENLKVLRFTPMLHLIGQPLAIDTFTYLQFLQSHKAGQVTETRQITKEPVKMFASAQINNYTQRELGWLGIQTAEGKDGLVAMITIRGATQRYSDWYQDGTEWVAQQIDICNGNPLVNSMLLRIDSPGGAVNGAQGLAATIRTSPKPILGWGSNMAASAACWYLSQCKECYIENEFTAVGSIGIMSIYRDVSEANEKAGEKYAIIRSKGSEDKNPLNGLESFAGEMQQKALQQEQQLVDNARKVFLGEVQAKRTGLTEDPGGGIFYGKEAVKMGFVDGILPFMDALKRADVLGIQYKRGA